MANRLELSITSNNGSLWIKTPRGWVLRTLDDNADYTPTCIRISDSRPELYRSLDEAFGRNVQVMGTKGQRRVNVCLSDFIKHMDIAGAVADLRRQTYLYDLMMIFLKDNLSRVSGTTHKQLLKILEVMVEQALVSELHVPRMRVLLVCTLKELMDVKSGRVGCKSVWNRHVQTVSNLCTKMEQFSYTPRTDDDSVYLTDLPKECIREIMLRLSDHRDILHLGATCSDLYYMSQDSSIWEKLTQRHFTEKQMLTFLEVTDEIGEYSHWHNLYRQCYKKFGVKYSYTDSLVICSACKTLHWMMIGHCCWSSDEKRENPFLEPIHPTELIQILNSS